MRFLLTGDDSTGSVAAFELMVPGAQRLRGSRAQPRPLRGDDLRHRRVLTWTVDGKQIDVGPGQALCIPRGAIHRFDNNGSQDVKALCVITPAAIGPQYFREAAEVINAAAGGPPDRAEDSEERPIPWPPHAGSRLRRSACIEPIVRVSKNLYDSSSLRIALACDLR